MIIKIILIIATYSGGVTIQEFNTMDGCLAAKKWVLENKQNSTSAECLRDTGSSNN